MSKGTVNKVIIIGNLGAAPDFRQAPGGAMVTTLSIAATNTWKDQSGQLQDHTEWHRVSVFGRTAEVARDYLRKGSKAYIEGNLRTRKWQDKNTGQDRYSTEVFVSEMQMLDRHNGNGQGPSHSGSSAPRGSATGQSRESPESAYPPTGGMDGFDDDIPFARPACLDGLWYRNDGAGFGNGPMFPFRRK
jgi:single-strand DNA-binding protein